MKLPVSIITSAPAYITGAAAALDHACPWSKAACPPFSAPLKQGQPRSLTRTVTGMDLPNSELEHPPRPAVFEYLDPLHPRCGLSRDKRFLRNRNDRLDLHSVPSLTHLSHASMPRRLQLSFCAWQRLHARLVGPSAILYPSVLLCPSELQGSRRHRKLQHGVGAVRRSKMSKPRSTVRRVYYDETTISKSSCMQGVPCMDGRGSRAPTLFTCGQVSL